MLNSILIESEAQLFYLLGFPFYYLNPAAFPAFAISDTKSLALHFTTNISFISFLPISISFSLTSL